MIKEIVRKYKFEFIASAIILLVFSYGFFSTELEFKRYGVETDAIVIECSKQKLNAACRVKIKFETIDKKVRIEDAVLYYEENCMIGKIVRIRYSTKSDLFDPIEE